MTLIDQLRSNWERFDKLDPGVPFVFVLATIGMLVRLTYLLFTPSLWAEDMSVLIEGVQKLGLKSIVRTPDGAGYHLFFQRLIASTLLIFPVKYAEWIFHVVAIAVIYFAFYVTWKCLPTKSFTARTFACLAILYVPINPSSIYLTLANTQWILGPIAMLLIVTDFVNSSRFKPGWCAVLAVLCLTGPFAVLALPVVFARMVFYWDFKREKLFYFSILIPIAFQTIALRKFAGARLNSSASDSISAWYTGIVRNTIKPFMPSQPILLLFGIFLVVLVWKFIREKNGKIRFQSSCLVFIALTNTAAGFYSYRYMPELVGPFGAGERYFLLPFLLFIFLILFLARGALRPIALFFIGFACIANARPIDAGTDGRGPNYWKSEIEAAQYMQDADIVTRPVWPNEFFKHAVHTPSPLRPPVIRSVEFGDVEFAWLAAARQPQGGWKITSAFVPQADARDLLKGTWSQSNVKVSDAPDGVTNVTIVGKSNELFQTFPVPESGGTLIFSFEARSDTPMAIQPHITDYKAGISFGRTLGTEWQTFSLDFYMKPMITTQGGVYVVLNSDPEGSFQVRNVRATFDTSPDHDRYMLIKVPDECRQFGNIALTYIASAGQPGFHRFDASASKDQFKNWNTQHRYVGPQDKNLLFAVPNNGTQWLRIRLEPPLEVRNPVLRCF